MAKIPSKKVAKKASGKKSTWNTGGKGALKGFSKSEMDRLGQGKGKRSTKKATKKAVKKAA
jgi:hypothetical protein